MHMVSVREKYAKTIIGLLKKAVQRQSQKVVEFRDFRVELKDK